MGSPTVLRGIINPICVSSVIVISLVVTQQIMFSSEALAKVQRKFEPKAAVVEKKTKVSFDDAEEKIAAAASRKRKHEDDEDSHDSQEGEESVDGEESTDADKQIRNEEADRTVFVGNLPISMQTRDVSLLFRPYGYVESVRLRSVPVAGTKVPEDEAGNQSLVKKICVNKGKLGDQKGSVNAYVVFREASSVQTAVAAMNNTVHGDRHIRVDASTPTLFEPSRSLFIGNLPFLCDEEELRQFFVGLLKRGDDAVEGVRIVRDQETLIGKGIAYVLLKDRDAVMAALSLPKTSLKYQKKFQLRVSQCTKPKTQRKRQRTDATNPRNVERRKVQDAVSRRIKLKKVETKKKFLENRKKKTQVNKKKAQKK